MRVAAWVAENFNLPLQVPLITDGQNEYPESNDTVLMSVSSGVPVQVYEVTSTTNDSNSST